MFSRILIAVLALSLLLPVGNVMAQTPAPSTQTSPSKVPNKAPDKAKLLTPEEEQKLAERSKDPDREVAGGALTTQQLTYIVIALAAAVIVLIAVH